MKFNVFSSWSDRQTVDRMGESPDLVENWDLVLQVIVNWGL